MRFFGAVFFLAAGEDDGVVLRLGAGALALALALLVLRFGAGAGAGASSSPASHAKIRFRQMQRYSSVRCKDTLLGADMAM